MSITLSQNQVTVHAPATVGNVVCGFDVLGLCLHKPYDTMHLKLLAEKKIIIKNDSDYDLPEEPSKNTAGAGLLKMIEEMTEPVGFEVTIEKNIKPGSGIGSSAASAAGAVVAANHLLGNIFSKEELIRFAMVGEAVASGGQHADNIAPCIYGGVTMVRSNHPVDIVSIPSPPLFVTVIHPQIEVRTADARKILRQHILLKDAVHQWANVAGLVAGFFKNDYALIGRSLEDVVAEPVRSVLIPCFDELKKECKKAGALGGGISGAGPSVFMLSVNEATALNIELAMKQVYAQTGIDFETYVTPINTKGVEIL